MPFCTQNGIFDSFGYWWPKFWGSKNWFFSIFQKCLLKRSYRWILLNNVFWRLWGSLSDNFWMAKVISCPFVKIRIFPKNAIFAIFGIFWMLVVSVAKKHKNCQKYENFEKQALYIPKMLLDTQNDIPWSLYSILCKIEN